MSVGESERRDQIRALLREGTLPADPEVRVWAGPGRGESACGACRDGIPGGQQEYEVVAPRAPSIILCQRCYAAWEQERWGRSP